MSSRSNVVRLGSRRLLEIQRKTDAIQLIGLFAILIPVWLVIANGQLANFTLDNLLGLSNRLTALIGTSLLLVHLALVARIPWIEQVLGLDKLTHAHKKLGKPLLYILVVHTLLATWSFAAIDGSGIATAFITLNLHYTEVLAATAALLLFVVVVISSIRIARKKLSYEGWYLVHLLSYAGVLLAIPHQIELGTDFLAQPLLKSYFTLLYVMVGLNLVWFRFLQPILLSLGAQLRVTSAKKEGNRTTSIVIGGRKVERFRAEAGHFFLLRVLTKKQWWRPHPFSVSNSPKDEIRFTVGERGDDTSWLQSITPGTRVILEGPFGVFTESKRTKQHVVLIAAGIGVAPIRALAESLAAKPGDVSVIYRSGDPKDAALLEEVEQICHRRGHTLHVLSGPRSPNPSFLPEQGKDETAKPDYARLIELAPNLLDADIYICGPGAWSKSVDQALTKLRVPKNQVHLEEFAW